MDSACWRLSFQPKAASLIISTDADTEVAPDWIAQNLAEVRRGAEAVGGRISLQPRDLQELDLQTKNIHLRNDRYHLLLSWLEDRCDPQAHDPWPRHYQHFGSSLAIKPRIYRQVGGLPAKEFLEDVALHEALLRHDVKFRHSPAVRVRTSGRLRGRTAVGLAEQLSRWSQGPSAIAVPSVLLWQTLFSLRSRLRACWKRVQSGQELGPSVLDDLSNACGARRDEIQEALACQWFGAAFERLNLRKKLENGLLRGETRQPLGDALRHLQEQWDATRRMRPDLFVAEAQSGIAAL